MKKLKKLNNKGMSLIELIICIAIIAFIALGMAGIFIPGAQLSGKAAVVNRVNSRLITQMELVAGGKDPINANNDIKAVDTNYTIESAGADPAETNKNVSFGLKFGTYDINGAQTSQAMHGTDEIKLEGNLKGYVVDAYEKGGTDPSGGAIRSQNLRIYVPDFSK